MKLKVLNYQEVCDKVLQLQQENKQLKEENYKLQKCINEEELDVQDQNRELALRIDKAIEYIKSYRDETANWYEFTILNKCELLEILGGKDENN